MSTYLVAFAIGKFDYVEGKTQGGIPMRVYTRVGCSDEGKFALDVGIKTLDFFSSYFNLPYPLPKLDMISIPNFAAGAMENWGLITYRETVLLCNMNSPVNVKQRVTYVVAHEEAHQWFGNICSPQWWKELWLNEGFATWAGNLAMDHLFPEWNTWTQFCKTYLASALNLDSLSSSHPIEVDVSRSRDIDEIFDVISYHKGSSVIRMLVDFLGEKLFSEGLHNYLVENSYGNAVTADLWNHLSLVSGQDVGNIMSDWTSKIGYPVISVEVEKDGFLKLSQKRFLISGEPTEEQDRTIWKIKIGIETCRGSGGNVVEHLDFTEKEKSIPFDTNFKWIKFNHKQIGVYRVKYSYDLMRKLAVAVREKAIGAEDRLGIISDALALSKAHYLSVPEILELMKSYEDEERYSVWCEIATTLSTIKSIFKDHSELSAKLKGYQSKIFSRILNKLGWKGENEDDLTKLLRSLVLVWCDSEASVLEEAKKRFSDYLNDNDSLSNDIRDAVFEIVASHGTRSEWEIFKRIFNKVESMPDLKILSLRCACRVPGLTRETLLWALKSGEVRSQDLHIVSAECAAIDKHVVWSILKENWNDFVGALKGQFLLSSVVSSATRGFTGNEDVEVKKFFETHKADGIERTVEQSIEYIRASAAWLRCELPRTIEWFGSQLN